MSEHVPAPLIAVFLLPLLAAATSPARAAGAEAYALDPVHTRVLLAVDHAGFSSALGTLSGSTGSLLFDPDDWSSARLDVRVPMARLDFGDARWNEAVLARRLLDAERYPEARFVASAAPPAESGRPQLCGDLTLHGVTRPLCMEVTVNGVERHPLPPFRRTAGFSATATLSRADFGIDAWQSVIGDRVELRIEAEAVRDNDAAAAFAPMPPADAAEPPAAPRVDTAAADAARAAADMAADMAADRAADADGTIDPAIGQSAPPTGDDPPSGSAPDPQPDPADGDRP